MYQYRIKQLIHFLQISPSYTFIPSPLNILIFQTSDQYPTTFRPILIIILSYSQLKIFQTSDQYILIHFSSDLYHHPFPFPVKNINTQNNVEINVSIQLDSKVYHSFLSLFSDPESKGRHFNHDRVNKNRVTW